MRLEYDKQADAVYIYLNDAPYAYGKELDDERRIDYSADGKPMGIELLCASEGINLDDLPERAEIAALLEGKHLKAFA